MRGLLGLMVLMVTSCTLKKHDDPAGDKWESDTGLTAPSPPFGGDDDGADGDSDDGADGDSDDGADADGGVV